MRAGARCDQWNKSTDKLLMCLKSWQSSVADGSRCSSRWCWEWNSSNQPSRRAAAHFLIFESLSQGEKSRWEVNRRARRRKQTTKHCERDWFECTRWLSIWYQIKTLFSLSSFRLNFNHKWGSPSHTKLEICWMDRRRRRWRSEFISVTKSFYTK